MGNLNLKAKWVGFIKGGMWLIKAEGVLDLLRGLENKI